MSAADPLEEDVREIPEFDLECLYDDSEDPSELTVFAPDSRTMTTEWITVDQSTAVPLTEVR